MSKEYEQMRLTIALKNIALRELRSPNTAVGSDYCKGFLDRNPQYTVSDYARLLEAAIERETVEIHELQAQMAALNENGNQPEPVVVGLKAAALKNKVLR